MITVRLARFRHSALAGLLCALLGAGSAAADAGTPVAFDIAAQDLAAALNAFALQSGRDVMFAPELAAKLKSTGVHGKLDVLVALKTLLTGTGLEYEVTPTTAIVVRKPRETAARINLTQAPRTERPAVAAAGEMQPVAGGEAMLAGHVTDAATGSSLVGALVRIVETGVTTRTDSMGRFHFRGLAAGGYTLTISYLGYPDKQWAASAGAEETVLEFALGVTEGNVSEMTVFGNRSSRALALNQQRTAENNVEVVSADFLGNFTGTTISEALRRVAGVTFQRDATTGAGTNIMIRGLEPDMNVVKINGLNLPVGNGKDRSANLNNLLTDSVSRITIHKTLLPGHDSSGTGGLVEIETKSPLERPERYVNLAVEGGRRGGDFGDNILVSGTVSRIFGSAKDFGLSVSAQYTEDTRQNSGYSTNLAFGEYLPLFNAAGVPVSGTYDLDPRTNFPYETGAGGVFPTGTYLNFTDSESSTLALTASGEWRPGESTSLRLDLQHAVNTASAFDASSLIQMSSGYRPREVAALGGEIRQALTYDGTAFVLPSYTVTDGRRNTTDTYSLRGTSQLDKWKLDYGGGFAHGAERTPSRKTLYLGFRASGGFYESFDENDFLPGAVDPVEGIILTPFDRSPGKGVPLPLFTPESWARVNDADRYYLTQAGDESVVGGNDRYTGNFDARYDVGGRVLKYLQGGMRLESARFDSRPNTSLQVYPVYTEVPNPNSPFPDSVGPSLAPLGMSFKPTDLSRIGHSGAGFHYLDEAGVRDFFGNLEEYAQNPAIIASIQRVQATALERAAFTKEQDLAAYFQGQLDFGKLEVIGGARLSHVTVRAVTVSGPRLFRDFAEDLDFARDFAKLLDESVTQTNLLPRVNLNFRQTDNLIFRAGYFQTTARPAIEQLSSQERIELSADPFYGPNFDQMRLTILRGNPGLKPAITDNFDVDVEYYRGDIGLIRLGAFYKRIENSLQNTEIQNVQDISDVDLPDHPAFADINTTNTIIESSRPENSRRPAKIWGAELHVERQFTFLPGIWSGFGTYLNYSYSDSEATQAFYWSEPVLDPDGFISYVPRALQIPGQRFNFQSAAAATVALTYNRRGIDASLAYGFQDRYQSSFTPNNLDSFTEGVSALDLRVAYFFNWNGMKWHAVLEGTDLLKGPSDPDLLTSNGGVGGIGKYYTGGTYLGGREFRMGIAATF